MKDKMLNLCNLFGTFSIFRERLWKVCQQTHLRTLEVYFKYVLLPKFNHVEIRLKKNETSISIIL